LLSYLFASTKNRVKNNTISDFLVGTVTLGIRSRPNGIYICECQIPTGASKINKFICVNKIDLFENVILAVFSGGDLYQLG